MTRLATTIAMITVLLVPTLSQAQTRNPREMVATHTKAGEMAMNSRDFNKALAEYMLAYAYDPSADRLVNVARAYEALGIGAVASELYQRVIAVAKTGPAADRAKRGLAVLGGGAAPPAAGGAAINLTVMPPGAEIWVDGTMRGKSPAPPLKLAPGPHRVEIRLMGYQTQVHNIQVGSAPITKVVNLMPGASTPAPPAGASTPTLLQVTDVPIGARVTIDGRPALVQGTQASASLAPGQYKLLVQHPSLGNFVKVITVIAGQPLAPVRVAMSTGRTPPTGLGTPPVAAAGSLVGSWQVFDLDGTRARETKETITFTLRSASSHYEGEMVVKAWKPLRGWERSKCNNDEQVSWEARYTISLRKLANGMRLFAGTVKVANCSCADMCTPDAEKKIEVFVSGDKRVMVSDEYVFVPAGGSKALMDRVQMAELNGDWMLRIGSASDARVAAMKLTGRPGSMSGTMSFTTATTLSGWRRRKCENATELRATHHFAISGEPKGSWMQMAFERLRVSDCSCSDQATCTAMGAQETIKSRKVRMTADGNHIVGPGILASRK